MIKELIKRKIKNSTRKVFKEIGREVNYEINHKLNIYKRKIIKEFISILALSAGMIFIGISIIFFMIEYLSLTKTLAFGIVGIVALFIGLLIKAAR